MCLDAFGRGICFVLHMIAVKIGCQRSDASQRRAWELKLIWPADLPSALPKYNTHIASKHFTVHLVCYNGYEHGRKTIRSLRLSPFQVDCSKVACIYLAHSCNSIQFTAPNTHHDSSLLLRVLGWRSIAEEGLGAVIPLLHEHLRRQVPMHLSHHVLRPN